MKNKLLFILRYVTLLAFSNISFGQAPNLGTASGFALFTGNGAFNVNVASVVTGDVGTNVGAFNGFPPGTLTGQIRLPSSPEAVQAATDVTSAYNSIDPIACDVILALPELGGQTLTPGVSCQNTASPTSLNGTLTLSGEGIYIIKLSSALTTGTNSVILLTNGASANNVFFQVNGAVTLGTGSTFKGTILAKNAIFLGTQAVLNGRALSVEGAITLNDNTVTIVPSVSLSAVAGACVPATNQYTVTGTISLTNASAGSAIITDGASTTTLSVNAGDTSIPYSLTGLTSGIGSHTVSVSYASTISSATYTAPTSCTVASASLGGLVFSDYNNNGLQDGSDTPIPGVVVTLLNATSTPVASTTTNASGTYSFTGLTSSVPYSVSFTTPAGYSATSSVTGPVTLTSGENNTTLGVGFSVLAPTLTLSASVDKATTTVGTALTYTIVLTNSGSGPANNVVVRDSTTTGLTYVVNSATVPAGTTFTQGTPVSSWSIATIGAGQSLTLTFQAVAGSSGILYNTVTIPGDTVSVCTSIPIQVCAGQDYEIVISAPAGYTTYQWLRNGTPIPLATTDSFTATSAGEYTVQVNNGSCPNGACCPVIIEEVSMPAALTLTATTPGCIGNVAQANGQITLLGLDANPYTYQYSVGNTFNEATAQPAVAVGATGVLANTLVGGQSYTVRVFNSAGCFSDLTVFIPTPICECKPVSCTPFTIQKLISKK